MNWLLLALLGAFCFGAYNVFIKIASGYIHEITGAVTAGTTNGRMNLSTYISLFVRMYGQKSLFALASFPYFRYFTLLKV